MRGWNRSTGHKTSKAVGGSISDTAKGAGNKANKGGRDAANSLKSVSHPTALFNN